MYRVSQFYRPKGAGVVSKILRKCAMQDKKFVVYYDPDIDGLVSGAIAQFFLKSLGIPSTYYINPNRGHGFKMPKEMIEKLKGCVVVAVDFSMSKEELEILTNLGVDVVCIDHHHLGNDVDNLIYIKNENGCEAVLINNQYVFEPSEWRFLSGAGMVLYTLGCINPSMLENEELMALVGLTLLSDVREIESELAEDILKVTFDRELNSPLIDYYLDITKPKNDYGFGQRVFDRNYIDYVFSPQVNALLRFNRNEDAVNLINGTLPLAFNEVLQRYRMAQQVKRDAIIEKCKDFKELEHINIKYVFFDEFPKDVDISNFIGIACSKMREMTGKTTVIIVFNIDGTIKRGSLRGNFDTVPYLDIFTQHGVKCGGHQGAFGIIEMSNDTDLDSISNIIGEYEKMEKHHQYDNRITNIGNLSIFLMNQACRKMAVKNNFLRDSKRLYIKYTGDNYKRYQKGKMWEYEIDGIKVKCFDEDLSLENGLLLPLEERGYIEFYLRRE